MRLRSTPARSPQPAAPRPGCRLDHRSGCLGGVPETVGSLREFERDLGFIERSLTDYQTAISDELSRVAPLYGEQSKSRLRGQRIRD